MLGNVGKICPFCHEVVIKEEGCNRIPCKCGKHWCYACPRGYAFGSENSRDVYNHLSKVHGGYWGKPE